MVVRKVLNDKECVQLRSLIVRVIALGPEFKVADRGRCGSVVEAFMEEL